MKALLNAMGLLLCAAGIAGATTAVWKIEPTATQAIVRVTTDQPGACTYRAAQDAGFSTPVHDVDPVLFPGMNTDSRAGSSVDGSTHTFVLGRRDAEKGSDGRHYSRALQANTAHWVGVTCGTDAEVVQPFQTQNPPFGQTYPEAAPFDNTAFGNYAWPSIDFTDQSKTYVDPMTGIGLKRITGAGWNNAQDYQNNAFTRVFDLNSAWTNASNALTWPGNGTVASYSGGGSDPLFLAVDLSTQPSYGWGALAVSGWTPLTTVDDVLVRTYGFGSDTTAANRAVLVCLSVDSGNTCNTPEISITLPAASARSGPTAPVSGFPRPAWTSWATSPPFAGRDFGDVITTVIASGHTITNTGTQSSQYFSRGWKAGGKVLVNGSEVYTIASVVNGSSITTVEAVTAHATAVSFKSLCAGVRIRKQTATGTVSLSAGYDFAVSGEFTMPLTGVRSLCSQLTVNVTVDANGNAAAARSARLCALQSEYTHSLFALFSDNGEARMLSNFNSTIGFQYHAPDWQIYDGTGPNRGVYTESDVWDPNVATRCYSFIQFNNGHYSLVRVDYTGNFSSWQPYPATNNYYVAGYWPDDHLTFTVVGGFPSQGRGVDQQTAAFGNPYFDPSQWNVWSFTGLLPGGVATWAVGTTGGSENPTFIVLQDVTTGNVTKVIDTISTYPLRFWGTHTTQILGGNFEVIANIPGNKGTSTSNYLGGWFVLYPTQIQQNGVWSSNTALTATYADTCPAGIDPKWQALGATGQNCILMMARQPCSDYASATEAAKFPCPWNAAKSMVSAVAPGDRFWIDLTANPSGETMRVVTPPVDQGGGVAQFWALRHSENYGNLGGTYNGTGNAHENGWTAAMIPPEARTNAAAAIAPDGTIYSESWSVSATHAGIGPGPTPPNLTSILSGADPVTGQPLYTAYGIRWNKPFASQVGNLPDYNVPSNGRFGGEDNGGGAMESYISMQQFQASANEKRWFLDLHHLNPSSGWGFEESAGIGAISASPVSGTANVYLFTAYPGNNGDTKRFPAMAFAGPYLLHDMSGPASLITDATTWAFCFVYKAGECRAGSSVGQAYTSAPQTDTGQTAAGGVTNGQCISGWYAQLNPCVMIPYSSAAWAMQIDASRAPTDDNTWRKLTQGFSGMGRQYQFGNVTATPDGTMAFAQCYWCDGVRNDIFAIQLPPIPNYDTVNRADFVPIKVQVPAGFGASARVKFGYAENGPVSSLFCTPRQEACVTDTAANPFAFVQSDTLAPAGCANGCAITVPAVSGRVLYYRIERLDAAGNVVSSDPLLAAAIP